LGAVDDYVARADRLADEDRSDEAVAVLESAFRLPLTARERARVVTEIGWRLYGTVPDGEARARAHAEDALRLLAAEAEAPDVLSVRGAAQCLLAYCLWSTDSRAGAETARLSVETLEQAMREPPGAPWLRWAPLDAARAYLLLDEGEKAVACSRRFLSVARSNTERLNGLGTLAEALRAAGRLAEGEQAVEEALRDSQGHAWLRPLLCRVAPRARRLRTHGHRPAAPADSLPR
jgi:tetratricopeptide (TPR) repeat protein